jgi:hypothetical protein
MCSQQWQAKTSPGWRLGANSIGWWGWGIAQAGLLACNNSCFPFIQFFQEFHQTQGGGGGSEYHQA